MGCDIHPFLEIESFEAGQCNSLYNVQPDLPRHYELFAAMAGVRGGATPLFPPRGIPDNLGACGFSVCYREIVSHIDAPENRQSNFVRPYEVGNAPMLSDLNTDRWGASTLGSIAHAMEVPSWLLLSDLRAAISHAGL
jgi:hypothetical protein